MMQNRIKVLGLTGGIASGKSAVSEILSANGGYILDADKISHSVILKGNPAYDEILACIPGDYLDQNGEISRKELGAIVFAESVYLKLLEQVVHKHVIDEITGEIARLNESRAFDFAVIDAPLLFESGLDKSCDSVWIIEAEIPLRITRLMARNSLSNEEARKRISIQGNGIPKQGYTVIENNQTLRELEEKVLHNLTAFRSN